MSAGAGRLVARENQVDARHTGLRVERRFRVVRADEKRDARRARGRGLRRPGGGRERSHQEHDPGDGQEFGDAHRTASYNLRAGRV